MKKVIAGTALLLTLFSACKKDKVNPEPQSQADVTFSYDGSNSFKSLDLKITPSDQFGMSHVYAPTTGSKEYLFAYTAKDSTLMIARSTNDGQSSFPVFWRKVNPKNAHGDLNAWLAPQ